MTSATLSRLVNVASFGRLKCGWWSSTYRSLESPIIVGGCSRSGTTLVQRMLNGHSRILVADETGILCSNRNLTHLSLVTGLPRALLEKHFRRSANIAEFFQRTMRYLMVARAKSQWGEKNPQNIRCLASIFRFFPRARFIHVIRDGRDVVCSLRSHPKYRWEDGRRVPTGISNPWDECVRRWHDDVTLALPWRADPRYREVRYEDVIRAPEETMAGLLAWLGEGWEPEIMQCFRTDKYYSQPELNRPINQGARGRWRRELPGEARALMAREVNQLLVEFGYARDQSWVHA